MKTSKLGSLGLSILIWGGILAGISQMDPKSPLQQIIKENIIDAIEEKPPEPPPPPPPPPKKTEKEPEKPVETTRTTNVTVTADVPTINTAQSEDPPAAPSVAAVEAPKCSSTGPQPKKKFDTSRAYPPRAIEREIEDTITVQISVSETGEMTGFAVTETKYPGMFDAAVAKEFKRLGWDPAVTSDCSKVAGTYNKKVQFRLD